ncbi:protein mono-ADP-ribosyltransferase TIPARP-like isoform X2 [Pseudophryne corroboree]|uniref:protein mono-ADP-ribosyltransferase TIPARP-like isoform X2 n=1 Tax=Pseudophryne corroboree TaxID=495146 RepID=UPI003081DD52
MSFRSHFFPALGMPPVRKRCRKSSLTPSEVTGLEPTREEIALHDLESGTETKPTESSEALVVQETPEVPRKEQLVTIFNINLMYHIHQNDDIDICSNHLVGHCSQFLLCPKHHTVLPYAWQLRYKSSNIWWNVEDGAQQVLERLYSDPAKAQVTGIHQCSALEFHTSYKYYYEVKDDVWEEYGPDFMKCIEEGLMDNCEEVFCKSSRYTYSLHLTDMVQNNLDTRTKRRMRKRPVFRSSALMTSTLWTLSSCLPPVCPPNSDSPSNKHKTAGSVYPNTWLITDTSLIYEETQLSFADSEYTAVYSYFHKTMPEHKYIIHQISRVQNYFQWEKYFRKRAYMSRSPGGTEKITLERHLFHGTKAANVEAICKQNFDSRVSKVAIYGKGCYFARNARYSHDYSHANTDGYRFMFLAKVLMGCPTVGQSSFVRPPPLSAEDPSSLLYDSCVNKSQNPDIFVVFDNDQFYPYFLIKYCEMLNVILLD